MENTSYQLKSTNFKSGKKPILSLILCSRNDKYMGNSRWRVETVLNYVAQNVYKIGRENDVEIILSDWGSPIPLREVLTLNEHAVNLTSFLEIPNDVARECQKDSPFSEVHALNAAARFAKGQYIGRIDADTMVGTQFLESIFQYFEGERSFEHDPGSTLIWANRRAIPYRYVCHSPDFWKIDEFINRYGRTLPIDTPAYPGQPYFDAPVGIWLLPRSCWEECGGFDENLIYWGGMEIDMIYRLMKKYPLVHLDDYLPCDFYHLEHYHPLKERVTARTMNPEDYVNEFHPNSSGWGLTEYELVPVSYSPQNTLNGQPKKQSVVFKGFLFGSYMVVGKARIAGDSFVLKARAGRKALLRFIQIWMHRTRKVFGVVHGKPIRYWPRQVMSLWTETRSGRNMT